MAPPVQVQVALVVRMLRIVRDPCSVARLLGGGLHHAHDSPLGSTGQRTPIPASGPADVIRRDSPEPVQPTAPPEDEHPTWGLFRVDSGSISGVAPGGAGATVRSSRCPELRTVVPWHTTTIRRPSAGC
ncbi:hypothetical protein ACFFX0_14965 [Citricoccus parietis]|uniref:Secreted protein n=1 Tax=Citricoccus parietis TaxID=592307 RepID=A0ABV5G0H1_9MICC